MTKKKKTNQNSQPRFLGSADGEAKHYGGYSIRVSRANLESLDDYLQNKFDYEIYNELTLEKSDYFDLFDPLCFFHLFYEQIDFIEANKNKPLFVYENLKSLIVSLEMEDEHLDCLCEKILDYFQKDKKKPYNHWNITLSTD